MNTLQKLLQEWERWLTETYVQIELRLTDDETEFLVHVVTTDGGVLLASAYDVSVEAAALVRLLQLAQGASDAPILKPKDGHTHREVP